MRGDQLTWHWEIPDSHPFASGIEHDFKEGFAGSTPPKSESNAAASAYEAGVRARDELQDDGRRFAELRVYLVGDEQVGYELTERSDPAD